MVKYRGSAHETNQYPFLITDRGFEVPPVTSVALDYGASRASGSPPAWPELDSDAVRRPFPGVVRAGQRVGGDREDYAGGAPDQCGVRAGRAGPAGSCLRNRRMEVIRNMGSLGLDLRALGGGGPAADVCGPVGRVRLGQPPGGGVWELVGESWRLRCRRRRRAGQPHPSGPPGTEVSLMLARKFHMFKARGVTGDNDRL